LSLKKGLDLQGFTLKQEDDLQEYRSTGIWYTHPSGLEVYHIKNSDQDKMFAFCFKTPPKDSTGVAHIMEHTVLCGSQDFPLKDPFVHLVKGSLNTYLNAWTFPDKTVYPASSTVSEDLYNILDVYADAVFRPLLDKKAFHQEGHHLAYTEEGGWHYSGVVFNEMKGNYSSQDNVVSDMASQSLFDSGPYNHDSGGDPLAIPDLTYEDFLQFHKDYYNLGNCQIVLYGDLDPKEYLKLLKEKVLARGAQGPKSPGIALQKTWAEPRKDTAKVPAGDDPQSQKASVVMSWLGTDVCDRQKLYEWAILSEILLGEGGLLSRAILDSGIGEDISPASGFHSEIRELCFFVGVRGTEQGKRDEFETLVLGALKKISEEGIDPDLIRSIIQSYEFRHREVKGTGMGIRFSLSLLSGWLHGVAPAQSLGFSQYMNTIKDRLEAGERLFENLIQEGLLNNNHRSTIAMVPDQVFSTEREATLDQSAKSAAETWGEEGQKQQRLFLQELDVFQSRVEEQEDLDKIPFLHLKDLPKTPQDYPLELRREDNGTSLFSLDQFTNGIGYFNFSFQLPALSVQEITLLTFLTKIFKSLGTEERDYQQISQEIKSSTGGIGLRFWTERDYGGQIRLLGSLQLSALYERWEDAFDLLGELTLCPGFGRGERLGELMEEVRNELMGALVPQGIRFAMLESASHLSQKSKISRLLGGFPQWDLVKSWTKEGAASLANVLRGLWTKILVHSRRWVSVSGEGEVIETLYPVVQRFLDQLPTVHPESTPGFVLPEIPPGADMTNFELPATVGYLSRAFAGKTLLDAGYTTQETILQHLRTAEFWETIRMKGGAYGAFARSSPTTGVVQFASYRDPHWQNTLEAFDQAFDRLIAEGITHRELEKTIMGILAEDLAPLSPGEKNGRGLFYQVMKLGYDERKSSPCQLL
jgi:Zn-dependent M16 (insulinase) family peptidase